MTLKQRFIEAIQRGELGSIDDRGVMVTLEDSRQYFADIKS